MKKLLFAVLLAGFWFNASKSTLNEEELREKAKRAIEHNVARFKSEQMSSFYETEFKISLKQEAQQLAKLMREFKDLQVQSTKIDDKNGATILDLNRKCVEARESFTRALQDLQMTLGPNKAFAPTIKENIQ